MLSERLTTATSENWPEGNVTTEPHVFFIQSHVDDLNSISFTNDRKPRNNIVGFRFSSVWG